MAIIGATELQPVNVVSNYLAGRESRQNQLAQQQEMAMRQQQMAMQQRAAQQEEESAAAESQQNELLRRTLAGGGGSRELMQAGLFGPGIKLGEYETSQAEAAGKLQDRTMKQRQAMFGILSVARDPQTYQTARQIAEGVGLDLTGIPEEYPGEEAINTIEDSLLTPAERAERAAKQETSAIQRGQLGISAGNLAVSQREQALREREFDAERADAEAATQAALAAARDTSALTPEQKRDRDVKFPKAQLAYKSATQDIDSIIADLRTLSGHKGLARITGGLEGRTPSFRAASTAAQALYDKILAKGQFRALQQMRDASPTGGALGNVSDTEGAMLRASFGALNQAQSDESLRSAIANVITDLTNARANITEAYDLDYPGKRAPQAAPAGTGGRKTASGTSYTVED
jgi:hypothetical protein